VVRVWKRFHAGHVGAKRFHVKLIFLTFENVSTGTVFYHPPALGEATFLFGGRHLGAHSIPRDVVVGALNPAV